MTMNNEYQFAIVTADGCIYTFIDVKAEDRDEAEMEAEIKAKRLCKRSNVSYDHINFVAIVG